jgi:hypothetical protein
MLMMTLAMLVCSLVPEEPTLDAGITFRDELKGAEDFLLTLRPAMIPCP